MKTLKALLVLLLVFSFVFNLSFYSMGANVWDSDFFGQESNDDTSIESTDALEKVVENGEMVLFADKKSGYFYIENLKTGDIWNSNPRNITEKDASGLHQMEALSTVLIKTYDEEENIIEKANSEALCVRTGETQYTEIDNGFRITYNFRDYGVTIPLEITLTEKGFKASVNIKGTDKNNRLMTISLLPFFHAGREDEEGYVLLPDGSGSLMFFNNGHTTAREYNMPIYGSDINSSVITKKRNTYDANLPVFGIKKENSAFLAIVGSAAAQASICASTNGKNTSFANCYSEFILRGSDTIVLGEETGLPQSYQLYQRDEIDIDRIDVEYILLTGKDVDYNAMATEYRQFLIEKYGLKEQTNSSAGLYLDYYGAVKKKKLFLGIPINVNETLSDTKAIKSVVDELKQAGVNQVNIVLKEWTKAQLAKKIDNGVRSVLKNGATKDIKDLSRFIEEAGGTLYPQFNIASASRSGNGVSVYKDSLHNISKMPAGQYVFKKNTLVKDKKVPKNYFLNVGAQQKAWIKIGNSLDKIGIKSAAFNGFGIYSDYNQDTVTRESNMKAVVKMLSSSNYEKMTIDFSPDFTFFAINTILNAPLESNNFSVTDCSIPFYQLSVSGLIDCVAPPLNLSSDYETYLLKAIETGSILHYSFLTEKNEKIMGTSLDMLYSADFGKWKDKILEAYSIVEEIKVLSEGSRMISHNRIDDGVYSVVYENKSAVYLNYNEEEYSIDGISIPSVGYRLREKDGGWK